MKRSFLFFALLAGIAVMTSCKKDQNVVTLKAVIGHDTKAYFGGDNLNLPYWDDNDEVYVAGQDIDPDSYGLSFPDDDDITTFATIEDVPPSSVYCAIYPATVVKEGSVSIPDATGSGITATIYFDPHQKYIWDRANNRQRINMPMGAVTTGHTLYFKNLCSILRVNVHNGLDRDFDVMKLTAHAIGNAYLTGYADVTLSEGGDPIMTVSSLNQQGQDNVLSLYNPNGESMGTIYHSNTNHNPTSKSFDIVVPKFTNAKLVLEVEMYQRTDNTDGTHTYSAIGYFADTTGTPGAQTGSQVSVGLNQITTIDLNINRITTYDYGYLEKGSDFNAHMLELIRENPNTTITTISFSQYKQELVLAGLYSWQTANNVQDTTFLPTGWKVVSTPYSPQKIWAHVDGNTIHINTWGDFIYANTDCSEMFKGLTTISSIHWNNAQEGGFITEDVTNMSSMFEGCRALSTIDGIGKFNTTNVTNMAHMFEGCSTLSGLTLTNFNTHNVIGAGMVAMFKDCSGLQNLDISSFTIGRITDLTNLFYGCEHLKTIDMRKFVISPNTTLTDMCYHLNYGNHRTDGNGNFTYNADNPVSDNICNITCKTDTWNTIKGQADLNNNPIDPITGLDLRIVKKSDTSVGK